MPDRNCTSLHGVGLLFSTVDPALLWGIRQMKWRFALILWLPDESIIIAILELWHHNVGARSASLTSATLPCGAGIRLEKAILPPGASDACSATMR